MDMEYLLRQPCGGAVTNVRDDGIVEKMDVDGGIYRQQDVTDIIASCHRQRIENDKLKGFIKHRDMQKIASIPTAVIDILAAHGIDLLNDKDALLKFVNDPAFAAFRTYGGTV